MLVADKLKPLQAMLHKALTGTNVKSDEVQATTRCERQDGEAHEEEATQQNEKPGLSVVEVQFIQQCLIWLSRGNHLDHRK